MSGRFSTATAVRSRPGGGWAAEVQEGFDIAGNANGGYLLAIAGRAVAAATGRPDPVTVTGHFLSPGKPGPVDIDVTVEKVGKRFSTARATLRAGDRPLLAVLGPDRCGARLALKAGAAAAALIHRPPPVARAPQRSGHGFPVVPVELPAAVAHHGARPDTERRAAWL